MIKVVPSILTNNPEEARQMLQRCEGVAERVSVDIIDGVFAENKTIEPIVFEDVETNLKIDYQLMTKDPINWVEKCVRGQADRIIGHVEMMSSQLEFVEKVVSVGLKVGLALDLDTPVEKIDKAILNDLDVVLVMSVKAGFGGQVFQDKAIDKILRLKELKEKDSSPYLIHVDGGINKDNLKKVNEAGADEVSIGRKLFEGNLEENIQILIQYLGNNSQLFRF